MQRTALRGGNPYRVKAYSRAADSLAALAVPLAVLIAQDRLTEIPGVGDAVAHIITKLHKTGSHASLEAAGALVGEKAPSIQIRRPGRDTDRRNGRRWRRGARPPPLHPILRLAGSVKGPRPRRPGPRQSSLDHDDTGCAFVAPFAQSESLRGRNIQVQHRFAKFPAMHVRETLVH